jgi:hypothetical protein
VPKDYIEYFKEHNVKAVVRLNKKMYEASRFTEAGVRHHEMYFPDGTCPSEQILLRFLDTAEREPGALAVSGVANSVVGRGRREKGKGGRQLYPAWGAWWSARQAGQRKLVCYQSYLRS